jgi:RHS repeat-associated protein
MKRFSTYFFAPMNSASSIVKRSAFVVAIMLLSFASYSQSVTINMGGSFCINSTSVFTVTASPCSSYSWYISGATQNIDYTLQNGSNQNQFVVRWLTAKSGITANCSYTCSSGSGTAQTSPFSTYPLPIAAATGQTVFSGQPTSIAITNTNGLTGVTYAWTVSQTGVTGGSTGSGSLIAQSLLTLTAASGTAVYTITPTSANYCVGSPITATVTVVAPSDPNSITSYVSQVEGITTSSLTSASPESVVKKVEYFDGLGRILQSVGVKSSPSKMDIVQPATYDGYGREVRKYLPFVAESNGLYKGVVIDPSNGALVGKALNFYNNTSDKIADDDRPFSESVLEASPLNRPLKEYGVGKAWSSVSGGNNKYVEYQYLHNIHGTSTGQEKIIAWKINGSGLPVRESAVTGYIETGGYFSSSQLSIKVTKDEEGAEVREYTNRNGQLILKKVRSVASTNDLNNRDHWAQTYFIYDDFALLRYVLQPELSRVVVQNDSYNPTTDDLRNLAFSYSYDDRGRMITKTTPGTEPVYIVYDYRNRVVLTQNGNQRTGATNAIKYWSFIKYDEWDRPIATGIMDTTTTVELTRADMQNVVNTFYDLMKTTKPWRRMGESYVGNVTNNAHGYGNKSYPVIIDNNKYLTITYYDNYTFRSLWSANTYLYGYRSDGLSSTVNGITYTQPTSESLNVIGQVTGVKTKVLDGGVVGGTTWLKSINYYNQKYQVIQTKVDVYGGGLNQTSSLVDFVGKVLKTKITQSRGVEWTDVVGSVANGNGLTRTLSGNSWNTSGAASSQILPANTDGWVEFTANEINKARMVGLSDQNTNNDYTTIDYALYARNDALISIYEGGVAKATISGAYSAGDIFRIQRTGTAIKYFRNGTEIYPNGATVTQTPSTSTLVVDASIYNTAGTVANARVCFGTAVLKRFDYDHMGRLVQTFHQIEGQANEVKIAQNDYNEIGQVVDKKLHSVNGSAPKQSVDFRYHIRGWLTSINNSTLTNDVTTNDDTGDYFGMNLAYNLTTLGVGNTARYDGNVSGVTWSKNLGLGTVKQNGFVYSYDSRKQLLSSTFKEKATSWTTPANNAFTETSFVYDMNGNIKALSRNDRRASGTMDILVFDHGTGATLSNKLLSVTDNGDDNTGFIDGANTGNDYTYDANGNTTADLNKGISTTYNYLNLPELVTRGATTTRFVYDAGGNKLSQIISYGTSARRTDYGGLFIYENNALTMLAHEEGRVVMLSEKLIQTLDGSSAAGMTLQNATATTVTINGNKYLEVNSDGTSLGGIRSLTQPFPAIPGERYKIKVKGYRTSTNAVYIQLRTNLGNITTGGSWYGAALPASAAIESWIEQIVTVPLGANQLDVGLLWDPVNQNHKFYVNDVEIVKLENSTPEYQYSIRDHLGNVRLTFTTKDDIENDKATMEPANASNERSKFLRYDNVRKVNAQIFDKTNDTASPPDGYSIRLSGNANEKTGLQKTLAVMPGDVIQMQVYAKYLDLNTSNWDAQLTNLVGLIASGNASVVSDGGAYSTNSSNPFAYTGLNGTGTSSGQGPKAYLNYIMFDKDFNPILPTTDPSQSNYVRMTTAAKEDGKNFLPNGVPHELLSATVTVKQPGYMMIYLSNEETSPVEVYFDDFQVTHTKSPVIQVDDYYPFGATFNSASKESSVDQKRLYQSKEWKDEAGLNLYDFEWRYYDPYTARTTTMDPMAEKFFPLSTYCWTANNPINVIDPDGQEIVESSLGTTYTGNDVFAGLLHAKRIMNSPGFRPIELKLDVADGFKFSYHAIKASIERREAEGKASSKEKEQKKATEPRHAIVVHVTDQIVGYTLTKSFDIRTADSRGVVLYQVPLYKVVVTGQNDKGELEMYTFAAVRFGVQRNRTGGPFVEGITGGTYMIDKWNPSAIHGAGGYHIDGAMKNNLAYFHAGQNAEYTNNRYPNSYVGCVGIMTVTIDREGEKVKYGWANFRGAMSRLGFGQVDALVIFRDAPKPSLIDSGKRWIP